MKSGKQRRAEILERRREREASKPLLLGGEVGREVTGGKAPCNPELLAPSNSYGQPTFVTRGYYMDILFQCVDCGKEETWRATQQKWWYEVVKGNVESRANRCNACRRVERARRDEARRVHLEGMEKKRGSPSPL